MQLKFSVQEFGISWRIDYFLDHFQIIALTILKAGALLKLLFDSKKSIYVSMIKDHR